MGLMLAFLFRDGLEKMYGTWIGAPEYSHGILIPFITTYLVWQRTDELKRLRFKGNWAGVACVAIGMAVFVAGELSAIYTLGQYAFLIVLLGLMLSLMGMAPFRMIAVPLLILAFMIPLPAFLYNNLSAKLQLLSSEIGVWVIRLFDISVYLEGSVIDLGSFKLQVVEACNGLRYLFPLMTLGFIVGYLYRAEFWKRAVVFLSTIPITVLMNSFRIGVIGVLVNRWGQSMAEGFLHDFEGWVTFMTCFGVLFVEMWLLMRITGDRRPLSTVFGLDALPMSNSASTSTRAREIPKPFALAVSVITITLISSLVMPERSEIAPQRTAFSEFPLAIREWEGQGDTLEQIYVDALKFTDYALINYKDSDDNVVNFYTAYYDSQRKGQSVHSPRSCLPGGGWEIQSLTQVALPEALVNGQPLQVNRALISYGEQKQLVYYWFQQRGRSITNEYLVKWYIFWDAITRNRTDGSLIRLTISLRPNAKIADLDNALARFAAAISDPLNDYIPN
ncbi:MAG: VPLPA-CTERM-specific exosortase XrtD [Gammaproteobacteria bacterium]|nr:VPLPA-CTERM-specific exosortase XrtD [Gammaproteobacteria bacterium]